MSAQTGWIENRISILRKFIDAGSIDYIEDIQILEALKAAREALESCEIDDQKYGFGHFFDYDLVSDAIHKIDSLGGKDDMEKNGSEEWKPQY